ncbi:MAG: PQQ-dependent sugar dehydrogenase [Bacteroidia bacterium]|nr:PQQ-dependent sugar dehydrogenase [Bacteroidia bacterium]
MDYTRFILAFTLLFGGIFLCQGQEPSFSQSQIGPNNFLNKPWDLEYAPDGSLWVTEREEGKIVRINPSSASKQTLVTITEVSSTANQDGLLGLALHPNFATDSPFAYVSYTYLDGGERRQKIVRFTYSISGVNSALSNPFTLIDQLPASNDHNSGRLVFGPDGKLYYSIGDQGGNQNRNFCNPILSQHLPTQEEIDLQNWENYPGKILRLNCDGSIPTDNPLFRSVQSHILSIGHRNPQGLVFSSNGMLYSNEHGPNTDDEINLISKGKNYGWPRVVGYLDDQAYDYCNWSLATDCENLSYSNGSCPTGVQALEESSFTDSLYQDPLFSLFAVPDSFDFNDPTCQNSWICRPNIAPSSIAIYESDAIEGWKNSLLTTSLKRGRIYRLQLDSTGTEIVGDTLHHFYTPNRYRDIAISADGKTIYIITDQSGSTSDLSGRNVVSSSNLQNKGSILQFSLISTDLEQEFPSNRLSCSIWPVPSSGHLNLEVNEVKSNVLSASIRSIQGNIIKKFEGLKAGRNLLDTKQLAAGLYILEVNDGGTGWQTKFVQE